MRFIKNHIGLFIFLFIFIVLAVASFLLLEKFIIFHGDSYGNRLQDLEGSHISNDELKKLENDFEEKESIKKAKAYVTGRIINIMNDVEGDPSLETLQSYQEIVFADVPEELRKLYDIQMIYKKENAENLFPIFGYLGKGLTEFRWSYQG